MSWRKSERSSVSTSTPGDIAVTDAVRTSSLQTEQSSDTGGVTGEEGIVPEESFLAEEVSGLHDAYLLGLGFALEHLGDLDGAGGDDEESGSLLALADDHVAFLVVVLVQDVRQLRQPIRRQPR